jgi:hypothetical protein
MLQRVICNKQINILGFRFYALYRGKNAPVLHERENLFLTPREEDRLREFDRVQRRIIGPTREEVPETGENCSRAYHRPCITDSGCGGVNEVHQHAGTLAAYNTGDISACFSLHFLLPSFFLLQRNQDRGKQSLLSSVLSVGCKVAKLHLFASPRQFVLLSAWKSSRTTKLILNLSLETFTCRCIAILVKILQL